MDVSDAVRRTARFDRSRRYRYTLGRIWEPDGKLAVFVLLNPSTADEKRDDPTIRRCMGFARDWGYGVLAVLNLFGWRTADPRELTDARDPVGKQNDRILRAAAAEADLVLVGWGNAGALQRRDEAVGAILARAGAPCFCLGITGAGQPRHPLYVARDTKPIPWSRALRGGAVPDPGAPRYSSPS